MTILVTGAMGMIGSRLVQNLIDVGYDVIAVDRREGNNIVQIDLTDKARLAEVAKKADRFIHLAALAHPENESDLSWEKYKEINVDCSKNVFEIAGERPVLYISTVDVFGFFDGKEPLNSNSPIRPVSKYGKSKALAEAECKKLNHFTIFRFSPVYTTSTTRDIQKRYYLKYPKIAYRVGKGTSFEILNVITAVKAMVDWCGEDPDNKVHIIKDTEMMWTPDYIKTEKSKGHANMVLYFPRWMVNFGYVIIKTVFGENEKTYLLNKAVHPLRTK